MINNKGEEVGIIYGWYNTKSGKWYVGQTIDEECRFKRHIYNAINKKDNSKFHRALRKYGLDNWVYCVLEDNILRENLNLKEQEWIEYYDSYYSGYNLTTGGDTNCIFSEEVKRKISESRKGQHSCWKGKHLPKETREKISNALKGQNKSEETKRKLSEYHKQLIGEKNSFYGRHHTEESKRKMSESHKGKRMSEETRKKISNTLKNKLTVLSKDV